MKRAGVSVQSTGLFAVAALLTACGGKTTQQDAPVIAIVDGQELTTADLGEAADRNNAERPTRTAVDSLIDEHLMEQQALAQGIDSDPAVVQALRNARRHILAEAFVSTIRSHGSPPADAEVEAYFRRNPALFEKRRLYSLTVFTVDSTALSNEVLQSLGHTNSAEKLDKLLKQHSIRFERQRLERLADELPIGQLPQYTAANLGDVLVVPDADGTTRLVQIAGIELRPNPFENARPAIQRYLAQLDQTAAVEAYLTRARSQARITYSNQGAIRSPTKRTPATSATHTTTAQHTTDSGSLTALN